MNRNPVPFYAADQALVDKLCNIIRALWEAAPPDISIDDIADNLKSGEYSSFCRIVGISE